MKWPEYDKPKTLCSCIGLGEVSMYGWSVRDPFCPVHTKDDENG